MEVALYVATLVALIWAFYELWRQPLPVRGATEAERLHFVRHLYVISAPAITLVWALLLVWVTTWWVFALFTVFTGLQIAGYIRLSRRIERLGA